MNSQIEPAGSARPTRWQVALWTMLLALTVFLSLHDFESFQVGTQRDDAEYITLARSLVQSGRYGLINQPGPPVPSQFPFGYPLLLATVGVLLPNNWDALKAFSLIATLVNGAILFWGWRWLSNRSTWWGLAVTGLYLLSPQTIGQTRMILPEPIFTTLYLVGMILAVRAARAKPGLVWLLALSATLVLLVFTRTLGWIFLASFAAYMLFFSRRNMYREMAAVAAAMLVIVSLVVAITPVEPGDLLPGVYARIFLGYATGTRVNPADRTIPFPIRLAGDAITHIDSDIPSAILPIGFGERGQEFFNQLGLTLLPRLMGIGLMAVVSFGFARWFQEEGLSVFLLSALAFLGPLFLWQWSGPRLLYPIVPQLLLALLVGLEGGAVWLARSVNVSTPKFVVQRGIVIAVAGLAAISFYKSWSIDDSRLHAGDLAERTAWVKDNTPPSAVIMSEEPVVDYLYGDRKTVGLPDSMATPGEFADYMQGHHVDYVLIAPKLEWQTPYAPRYDDGANRALVWLGELAAAKQATRVYSMGKDSIQVYKNQ